MSNDNGDGDDNTVVPFLKPSSSPRDTLEETLALEAHLKRVVVICEWESGQCNFGHSEMTESDLWWMMTQAVASLQKLLDLRVAQSSTLPPQAG